MFRYLILTGLTLALSAAESQRHRFIVADNAKASNGVVLVDQFAPERGWRTNFPADQGYKPVRDLQLIGEHHILVSTNKGYAELDVADGSIHKQCDHWSGISSARRLPNGHTLLLLHREREVIELNGNDVEINRIKLAKGGRRLLRQGPGGTWVVGDANAVYELAAHGSDVLTEISNPVGKSYCVNRTWRGHYLASGGDGVKVIELKPDGSMAQTWGPDDKHHYPHLGLDFSSGYHPLPWGGVAVTNWLGHLPASDKDWRSRLVAYGPDNTIVWHWNDPHAATDCTNVLVIDHYARKLTPVQATILKQTVQSFTSGSVLPAPSLIAPELSLADAYRISDRLAFDLSEHYGPISGYKVAFASAPALAKLGLDQPLAGRLHEAQFRPTGGTIPVSAFLQKVIVEPEIGFRLGQRISEPLTSIADLKQLVASVHPTIELPHPRILDRPSGPAEWCATGLAAGYVIVGEGHDPATVDLPACSASIERDGSVVCQGVGSELIGGDPWQAALWLVNHMIERGFPLEAGQMIVGGTVANPPYTAANHDQASGHYHADFGPLGTVSVTLTP
ncbi:MAG: 2-keto-4-pentenoate hydratase [Planctomycetota bacterium]